MKPRIPHHPVSGLRARALAGAALAAGACALVAGCAGTAGGSSSSAGSVAVGGGAAALPAAPRAAGQPASGLQSAGGVKLPGLPAASQAIIYTASVTIRSGNLTRAAALASQLATAAGGYVASENTSISPHHPGRSTVSLRLKIPVSAYQSTLNELTSGRLGSQVSLQRQAQDVTQTVADVNSRVASARAAIAQLRALLARSGSVASLLEVQNQINTEEADLESLQAQQRALTAQTSYATVSVLLEGKPLPGSGHQRASGFLAGLAAGWHAFTRATVALLTGLGAAAPFVIVLAVLGFGGYRGWRWRQGRRERPAPPGEAAAG